MANSVGGESSSSSHTSDSTPPPWEYDVFLSFAGKDTRLNFTGHLDEAFNRSGIKTFRDDVDLEKGEDIKQGLFHAIENSLCAVLVISENYAESGWCLEELEKILESRNKLGQLVFPIFYNVNPGDVKNLRNSFEKALAKHDETFKEDKEKVQNWRNVLSQIGSISGEDTRGKHEADLIKKIVGDVWTYLSSKLPSDDDKLVGIDSRVANMMPLLEIGLDEPRFVGIWGMGGVGKSTLARVVSEKLSHKFEVCCFLDNVRETLLQREGIVSLQKTLLSYLKIQNMEIHGAYLGKKMIRKLLCNKKVLLVLDDVDDMSQLKNLAESSDWFGKGSRIIITTRDSHLLTSSRVQVIYEMKTMKKDESLQLFSNKAFHKDHPEENYLKLSESVVEYAGGLPLALEVLGSYFCGRNKAEWIDALDRLKQIPDDNKIIEVLKISFDGLKNEKEKEIFLDIACFFKGREKKEVTQILESCDLNPTIGIKVLIEKALLVETKDGKLEMHDLLEEFGKYMVYQESPNVGERSRLWKFENVKEVLEKNMGSKAVQAIVMGGYNWDMGKIEVHPEAFSKMSNIRLIYFMNYNDQLVLPRRLKLSRSLKVVIWSSFSLEALPLETSLDKLVHVHMPSSNIKQLWNGRQVMNKLKFIDLSYSENLMETPDFSGVPNLEHLCLKLCKSLVKVHDSVGKLKTLVEVDLTHCVNLEMLPKKLETDSLVKLDLMNCKKVAELPEFGEGMKKLSILDVSGTAIIRLPKSFGSLIGLRRLNLGNCKILNLGEWGKAHISRQVSRLNVMLLTELDLGACHLSDGSIPDDFGSLSASLVVLNLSCNDFVNLPYDCFSSLDRLALLFLGGCVNLKSLPRLPPRLIRLSASGCDSMEPLSDVQLWNLVASLDHEYRGRTKIVMYEEKNDEISSLDMRKDIEAVVESLLLRDFCATIPTRSKEIPSWFGPNKKYYYVDEDEDGGENKKDYGDVQEYRREFEIQVDIPQHFHHNGWSGIVVCFLYGFEGSSTVKWSSKGAEDDDYIFNDWAHYLGRRHNNCCGMWMMVLELNEETCWRHLRSSHNNSLHIKFHIKLNTFKPQAIHHDSSLTFIPIASEKGSQHRHHHNVSEDKDYLRIRSVCTGLRSPSRRMGCGWRVICKEEIKEWCTLNNFNQPLLPSPHHHTTPLSSSMLSRLTVNWLRREPVTECLKGKHLKG